MMKTLKFIGLAILACCLLFVSCKKTKQYTITVTVNDASMGSATGGGVYDEKATATLKATANANYVFAQWEDGNKDNPRSVTVTKDATYKAIFIFDGDGPEEDGVFVTMGTDSWKVASFLVDAQSLPGNIRMWLYKSDETEYPQFQGWMGNSTGNVNADMWYMAYDNDVDAAGYPNWETKEMTTTVSAIDLNSRTITAVQTGTMRNRSTTEERALHILYKNAIWEASPTPSKSWKSAR
jgi:hypothetical protein